MTFDYLASRAATTGELLEKVSTAMCNRDTYLNIIEEDAMDQYLRINQNYRKCRSVRSGCIGSISFNYVQDKLLFFKVVILVRYINLLIRYVLERKGLW